MGMFLYKLHGSKIFGKIKKFQMTRINWKKKLANGDPKSGATCKPDPPGRNDFGLS